MIGKTATSARSPAGRKSLLIGLIAVLGLLVLAADVWLPTGVAAGTPYAAIVLLSLFLDDRRSVPIAAGLTTALAVGGFFLPVPPSPTERIFYIALGNRSIAVLAIWAVAFLAIAVRRQTAEVRQQNEFNRRLIETASSIILTLDADGRIVQFNPFGADVTGHAEEEVLGRDWFETFIPRREQARARRAFREAIGNTIHRDSMIPIVCRDGEERCFSWSSQPMRVADETMLLYVGQDITPYVRSEQRRVHAERLAAIGQTVTTISHEARNDLAVLRMAVELLESAPDDTPTPGVMSEMRQAVTHLATLLEDVRSYAAPLVLDWSVLPLAEVWRQAWSSLRPLTDGRSVQLLETSCDDMRVSVDEFRMGQVFRNIFENSLAICSDPVCVEVICERPAGQSLLEVTVRDNGPGIPQQIRSRLFEPFATTRREGTGLGMAIAKRIVEAHGGSLWVLDESGAGAAFRFRLPAEPFEPGRQSPQSGSPPGASA